MAVNLGISMQGRTSIWAGKTYGNRGIFVPEFVQYHTRLTQGESDRVHAEETTGRYTPKEELETRIRSDTSPFAHHYGVVPNTMRKLTPSGEPSYRIALLGCRPERKEEYERNGWDPLIVRINGVDVNVMAYTNDQLAKLIKEGAIDITACGYDELAVEDGLRASWGLPQPVKSIIRIHGSALLDVNEHHGDFSIHNYAAPEGVSVKYRADGTPVFAGSGVKGIMVDGYFIPWYKIIDPENAGLFVDHIKGSFDGKQEYDAAVNGFADLTITNSGRTRRDMHERIKREGKLPPIVRGMPKGETETVLTTRKGFEDEPSGQDMRRVLAALEPVGYNYPRRIAQQGLWFEEMARNLNGIWENGPKDFDQYRRYWLDKAAA